MKILDTIVRKRKRIQKEPQFVKVTPDEVKKVAEKESADAAARAAARAEAKKKAGQASGNNAAAKPKKPKKPLPKASDLGDRWPKVRIWCGAGWGDLVTTDEEAFSYIERKMKGRELDVATRSMISLLFIILDEEPTADCHDEFHRYVTRDGKIKDVVTQKENRRKKIFEKQEDRTRLDFKRVAFITERAFNGAPMGVVAYFFLYTWSENAMRVSFVLEERDPRYVIEPSPSDADPSPSAADADMAAAEQNQPTEMAEDTERDDCE